MAGVTRVIPLVAQSVERLSVTQQERDHNPPGGQGSICVMSRSAERKRVYMAQYRLSKAVDIKAYQAAYRQKLRDEAFSRYGHVCAVCGFDNPLALQIDHIDDNGAKERLSGLGNSRQAGWKFYLYLKQQGWPDGYQTLCANHNTIKQASKWLGDVAQTVEQRTGSA